MASIIRFIVDRLMERSTWIGIISLVSAVGLTLKPELKEAIITAGLGLAGVAATITPDK